MKQTSRQKEERKKNGNDEWTSNDERKLYEIVVHHQL